MAYNGCTVCPSHRLCATTTVLILIFTKLSQNYHYQVPQCVFSSFCDPNIFVFVIVLCIILVNISWMRNSFISHAIFTELVQKDHYQVLQGIYSGLCDSIISGGVIALCLILLHISSVRNFSYISHAIFIKPSQNDHYQVLQCI